MRTNYHSPGTNKGCILGKTTWPSISLLQKEDQSSSTALLGGVPCFLGWSISHSTLLPTYSVCQTKKRKAKKRKLKWNTKNDQEWGGAALPLIANLDLSPYLGWGGVFSSYQTASLALLPVSHGLQAPCPAIMWLEGTIAELLMFFDVFSFFQTIFVFCSRTIIQVVAVVAAAVVAAAVGAFVIVVLVIYSYFLELGVFRVTGTVTG